jgi:hypothetical protein
MLNGMIDEKQLFAGHGERIWTRLQEQEQEQM